MVQYYQPTNHGDRIFLAVLLLERFLLFKNLLTTPIPNLKADQRPLLNMILVSCDELEDFVDFLNSRTANELFVEIQTDFGPEDHTKEIPIVLQFLGKLGEIQVLYTYRFNFTADIAPSSAAEVKEQIQLLFKKHWQDQEIKLIVGKIREIYMSLA